MPPEQLAVAYVSHWRRVTVRELAEVLGGELGEVSVLLESLVTSGLLMQADDSQSQVPIYVPAPQQ